MQIDKVHREYKDTSPMTDKKIQLVANLYAEGAESVEHKKLSQLYDGLGRRMVAVHLDRGEELSKHSAAEPISVLCFEGSGLFRAGDELDESCRLEPGTLITLEPDIPHEVTTVEGLRLLVTKFKKY